MEWILVKNNRTFKHLGLYFVMQEGRSKHAGIGMYNDFTRKFEILIHDIYDLSRKFKLGEVTHCYEAKEEFIPHIPSFELTDDKKITNFQDFINCIKKVVSGVEEDMCIPQIISSFDSNCDWRILCRIKNFGDKSKVCLDCIDECKYELQKYFCK